MKDSNSVLLYLSLYIEIENNNFISDFDCSKLITLITKIYIAIIYNIIELYDIIIQQFDIMRNSVTFTSRL